MKWCGCLAAIYLPVVTMSARTNISFCNNCRSRTPTAAPARYSWLFFSPPSQIILYSVTKKNDFQLKILPGFIHLQENEPHTTFMGIKEHLILEKYLPGQINLCGISCPLLFLIKTSTISGIIQPVGKSSENLCELTGLRGREKKTSSALHNQTPWCKRT